MSAWSRAAELAERTPVSRNRYVDFLRAMSMLVVVVGHWLAAAPYLDATDNLTSSHILTAVPWTAWLIWLVQVMPIFFLVGGYPNGISWRAARRDRKSYAAWLEGRYAVSCGQSCHCSWFGSGSSPSSTPAACARS
jgi:hypothetical protein